jgi:hypothetical protein
MTLFFILFCVILASTNERKCDTGLFLFIYLSFIYFILAVLGFELRAYTLSHSTSLILCWVFFQGRVSWTICPGWLWTSILLISASWVAGITGMSHQNPIGLFRLTWSFRQSSRDWLHTRCWPFITILEWPRVTASFLWHLCSTKEAILATFYLFFHSNTVLFISVSIEHIDVLYFHLVQKNWLLILEVFFDVCFKTSDPPPGPDFLLVGLSSLSFLIQVVILLVLSMTDSDFQLYPGCLINYVRRFCISLAFLC